MGQLLSEKCSNILSDVDSSDVDYLFKQYDQLRLSGSTEGLGRIASNIAIAFSDLILRLTGNLKLQLTGMFKDIKQSSLQALLHHNKIRMISVMKSDYTEVKDILCPRWNFTTSPDDVISYCGETFKIFTMLKRMSDLIDSYNHLAAAINIGDINLAAGIIDKIIILNMKPSDNVKRVLSTMVTNTSTQSSTYFGTVFNSMQEYKDVMNKALSTDELDTSIKVAKSLGNLYGAFDKVNAAITKASTTNNDISRLSHIVSTVYDTGSLLESYAMVVTEYHHLEWWLKGVTEELMKNDKK